MNFKIAVCDDEKVICSTLNNELKSLSKLKSVIFEIDCFSSGEELCSEMKHTDYDLLFLDIELPKMDGVAVGEYIRESLENETIQIAYISSKQEYAMELFEMRPINFLVKPLSEAKIENVIDKFLQLNKIDTKLFSFKVGRNYYKVPFSEILYFYSIGRKIYIVAMNKEYEFYGSLDDIYSEVKNKKFLFVHKSFLVNFKHIRKYQYEQLTMSDNKNIPVSQSRRKAVRSMFVEFEGE
ncbi:MAG: LytR/AlgR family response regulator transcription factor [Ruminococcus sp.]